MFECHFGWTETQSTSGATLWPAGSSSVDEASAFLPSLGYSERGFQLRYMEIVAFKGASSVPTPVPPPGPAPLVISTTTLPAGTVGKAYSATLAATGGALALHLVREQSAGRSFHKQRGDNLSGMPTTGQVHKWPY